MPPHCTAAQLCREAAEPAPGLGAGAAEEGCCQVRCPGAPTPFLSGDLFSGEGRLWQRGRTAEENGELGHPRAVRKRVQPLFEADRTQLSKGAVRALASAGCSIQL